MNSEERQKLRELARVTEISIGPTILDLLDDLDRLEATVRRLVEDEPVLETSYEDTAGRDCYYECGYCEVQTPRSVPGPADQPTNHADDCPWLQAKREFGE